MKVIGSIIINKNGTQQNLRKHALRDTFLSLVVDNFKKMIRHQNILLLTIGIFLCTAVYSQGNYEPTILILTPNATSADKQLKKVIKSFDKEIKQSQEKAVKESEKTLAEIGDRAENVKIMYQKKIEFSKDMGLYSLIPLIAEGYLQYRFYERFTNLLIYAINEKSKGSVDELSTLANNHEMQYILNFPKVNSYVENGTKKSAITVQLYDNVQKQILFEKEYIGEDRNPGFEFACSDSSLHCTFNNALSQALGEIISVVASNNPTIIREKQLAQERTDMLFTTYYPKIPASEIVEIISKNDTSISTDGFYHGFMDESKTKFIGFFAYNSSASSFSDVKDSKDKNVNIITDDLTDLDNVPRIYAHIVLGIQYESKWYIQKSNVTYFNADDFETGKKEYFNNLQKWNFFKEESSEFNPDFWETYFFSKVESSVERNKDKIEEYTKLKEQVTNDEDKEIYQDMINDFYEDDLKNQGYFELYDIVASEMRKQDREQREQFEINFSETVLTPFFSSYIKKSDMGILEYKKLNGKKFAIIYPRDKSIFLCPILFNYKDDKSELHYYILIPADNDHHIYKWNYFEPVTPKYNSMYGGDINEQLNTITTWNFSFDYLEDKKFWNKYVLKKSGDNYDYLEEIK